MYSELWKSDCNRVSAKAWLEWKRGTWLNVYYDAFLANGKNKEEIETLKLEKLLRLVN
jgi:hypothetical protein